MSVALRANVLGDLTTYSGSSPVITSSGASYYINWSTNTTATSTGFSYKPGNAYTYGDLEEAWYDGAACKVAGDVKLRAGQNRELPDGAKLIIDDQGNYKIEDKDAQVIYKANRIRDFSPHLNASDMVADFMKYVGSLGLNQQQVMKLPMDLFVNWLVITAAERDHDPVPDGIIPVEKSTVVLELKRPRCLYCQRFISRVNFERKFQFCSLDHGGKHLIRLHNTSQKRLELTQTP